jgi:hypothetical protein
VHILAAVGEVLLPPTTGERYGLPKRLIVATDALSVVDADALLSLIGAVGSDHFLLKLAGRIWLEHFPFASDRLTLES